MRPDLAEELDLPTPERPPGPQASSPVAVEAQKLPHAIQTQTSGLNRVALEMTLEEPIIQIHISLGHDPATALLTRDFQDAIHHQHGRRRQARLQGLGCVFDQATVRESKQLMLFKRAQIGKRCNLFLNTK